MKSIAFDKRKTIELLFLLVLLVSPCLILYVPAFSYFFAQDDFYFLNRILNHGLDDPVSLLKPVGPFYRPVSTTVYFAAMRKLFGLEPLPYHAFSLTVFCGIVLLVYYVGNSIFQSQRGGFITALFYLTRGVHFDAVSWISGIQDLLMVFFLLVSMNLYLRCSQGSKKHCYYSLGAFVVALLSKETAIVYPFILLSYELILNDARSVRARWVVLTPFFLADGLFVLFRIFFVHPMPETGEYAVGLGLFWVSNMINYFMSCINIFFLPFIISPRYLRYAPQLLLSIALLLSIVLFFERKRRAGNAGTSARNRIRLAAFGAAFFLLGSMPAWQFQNKFEPYYMSLASVGIALGLTAALSALSYRKLQAAILVGACLLSLIVNIQVRGNQLSHVAKFAPVARHAIQEMGPLLGECPSGTTLFISDSDQYLWLALSWGEGIRVFFPCVETVVFDFRSPDYPLDGSEIVYQYQPNSVDSSD